MTIVLENKSSVLFDKINESLHVNGLDKKIDLYYIGDNDTGNISIYSKEYDIVPDLLNILSGCIKINNCLGEK